ncbi:hypothetical protein CC80DRAFT_464013 [Byssothecium circinans]|uniref:Uncharacterized protein n=1 Tax=Byssothecium circinans TaxID=147558 RepID=A0A6A5U991_9PLEO|nr:hypothetical protein CC80DRAFT_464013 [Byssothecium circinans]
MSSTPMSSPECKSIVDFQKTIAGVPSNFKGPLEAISKDTLDKLTDTGALTVWETDADIDGLLQLTEVFFKIKAANAAPDGNAGSGWGGSGKSNRKKAMGAVIISQEMNDRNAYQRIIDVLRHLKDTRGDSHCNGNVHAFDSIVVVRGINYSKTRTKNQENEVLRCINVSIEKVLKMTRRSSSSTKSKIIWHHGPAIYLLLHWINNTTNELRSALTSITVTAALTFADGIKPSPLGASNTPKYFETLEKYAKRLSITVTFLDPITQLIHNEYASHFIYYFGYYITMFLPATVTRPHYDKALDHLTTFAFRLWGAAKGTHDSAVVAQVKQHLNGERACRWAKICIDLSSYEKQTCFSAGQEVALQHAASLADAPWAMYTSLPNCPLPAFTRLAVCPGATPQDLYTAVPVSFNYNTSTYRVANPSPFRLLVPKDGVDVAKMEKHIQGTMTAVLTRVMQAKEKKNVGETEARDWNDVLRAVCWAMNDCLKELPEGVRGKVEVVGRMLVVSGCWGYLVKNGAGGGAGGGDGKLAEAWGK